MDRVWIWVLCVIAGPCAVQAHPHVFVDTLVRVLIDDQGRLTGLRASWVLDETTSALLLEQNGFDPATADRAAAQAVASGFDWQVFTEALHGAVGEVALDWSGADARTGLYQEGLIALAGTWTFAAPVALTQTAQIQIYDPTFYISYGTLPPEVVGPAGCRAWVEAADLDAAQAKLEEMFDAMPAEAIAENAFPEVGAFYADALRIACD